MIMYSSAPIGTVSAFAMATPPTDWLQCNGAAVSRTTYSALFAAIGTAFGEGNGTTTFNLPNIEDVALVYCIKALNTDSSRVLNAAEKGIANGVATLDASGKIPATQLNEGINGLLIGGSNRTGKDAEDIYVTTNYKDVNGVVRKKSVLSGGTSPNYTTRTETVYDTDGTTVLYERVYTQQYDGTEWIGETLDA
jgi:hypothetical protein